jgi:hypothetical protein
MRQEATAAEAACVTTVLATETSAQETAMVQDSTALCVKDAKDWVALVERAALGKVSRGCRMPCSEDCPF